MNDAVKTQEKIHRQTREYYGQTLRGSESLKTNACSTGNMSDKEKGLAVKVHPEVLSRFYGCGFVVPEHIKGVRVLDLGSGAGRDVYMLAQMVGKQGFVVGVDMTDEQLAVARRYQIYHRDQFGYKQSNTRFVHGKLEHLDQCKTIGKDFDVIVSNCVLNLCADKHAVLQHTWNLLKEGGEFYFSDVYADRRVEQRLIDDPVLHGECISGAMYYRDFLSLARQIGFEPRLVSSRRYALDKDDKDSVKLAKKVAGYAFYEATYRLFKIFDLDDFPEDYGQQVMYKGHRTFALDQQHTFDAGDMVRVSQNTYRTLKESRFSRQFKFFSGKGLHQGRFPQLENAFPFSDDKSESGCC